MPVARVHPSVSAFSRGRRRLASRTRIDTVLELRDIRHRRMANAVDGGETGDAAVAVEPQDGLEGADAELARQALDVLVENWIGHATKPSPRLYPHQWSWDSACHAIGYARFDQDRAEQELLSLFRGQWRNGMLPHIVFTDGAQYFPGPEFWQTDRSPDAPEQPLTSGIVQPPIHATAALHVYRVGKDRQRAAAFASVMLPKLEAWHDYIYRERTRDAALAEVWHPWETGMDNSPLWDEPLARIEFLPEDVPVVPPRRHRARGGLGATDERRVRPLRVPRARLSRARLRRGGDPRGVAVRRAGRHLQLAARPVEPRSGRACPRGGRRSGAARSARRGDGGDDERAALGRRPWRCTATATCVPTSSSRR